MKEYAGKMKVAIVAYGHADNVICLSNHLSKYADVTLIFVTAGDRFTRSVFDWDITKLPFGLITDSNVISNYIGKIILSYISPNIKIYLVHTPTRKIVKDWKRENMKYIKEVAEYIKNNAYDAVHFNGFSGFQLYFHWYLRRMPKVYTIHDYLPHSGEWKRTPVILHKLYSKLNYQFIQHYHFLTERLSEFYGIQADRVHTVYCGPLEIYRVFLNKPISEEPHTILFFGRISYYKGIEYLVQAVPKIKEHIPDVKIIIAGKGDFWFKFKDREKYEIYNYHVSNKELVNLIQRASIVVTPYTDATHSAVIMTAYAFNKPVVASAVGGIPEVVDDHVTGRLVPPSNSQALANAIIELLSNSKKRKRMKQNIQKKCSEGKLAWDHIAKQTIGVYKKALKIHRS